MCNTLKNKSLQKTYLINYCAENQRFAQTAGVLAVYAAKPLLHGTPKRTQSNTVFYDFLSRTGVNTAVGTALSL